MQINAKLKKLPNLNLTKLELPNTFLIKNHFQFTNPLTSNMKNSLIKKLEDNFSISLETLNKLKKATKVEILNLKQNQFDVFFSFNKACLKLNQNDNNPIIIIAKFKKIKNLLSFCKNIQTTFESICLSSELYQFNNQSFILITQTTIKLENDLTSLMTEFNATTNKGKFQEAIVKEHCQQIFSELAIEKISMCDI